MTQHRIGICKLINIPVRYSTTDRSEMVTQLLYGERFDVLQADGEWLYIRSHTDGYQGWVDSKQCIVSDAWQVERPEMQRERVNLPGEYYVEYSNGSVRRLEVGSYVFRDNEGRLRGLEDEIISGSKTRLMLPGNVQDFAIHYLATPYLWGGRCASGIDCSGFVQIVFGSYGIALPRDASQQEAMGEHVPFNEQKPGDVAFFNRGGTAVTHVGIVLSSGRIIHACGYVRVDNIDSKGIILVNEGGYSHYLISIKRFRRPE